MERKRKRFIALGILFVLLLAGIIYIQIKLHFFLLTVLLLIPVSMYLYYIITRIKKFVSTFKPNVVNLILDYIDNTVNYGRLTYDSSRCIDKKKFFHSHIFGDKVDIYEGEDYIKGKIGELDFEMCELNAEYFSNVTGDMEKIFKGIFLHTAFNEEIKGEIIVIPKKSKQYFSKTIRRMNLKNGRNLDEDMTNKAFMEYFTTYGTEAAKIHGLLSERMQATMINYHLKTKKDLFFSFIDNDLYVAVEEPKDILEPYIFRSNANFDLIYDFYARLTMLISIVQDFDESH